MLMKNSLILISALVATSNALAVEFCNKPAQEGALYCEDFSDGKAQNLIKKSFFQTEVNAAGRYQINLPASNQFIYLKKWLAVSLKRTPLELNNFSYSALMRNGINGNQSMLVFKATDDLGTYEDSSYPTRYGSGLFFSIDCNTKQWYLKALTKQNRYYIKDDPLFTSDKKTYEYSGQIKGNKLNCEPGQFNTLRANVSSSDNLRVDLFVNNNHQITIDTIPEVIFPGNHVGVAGIFNSLNNRKDSNYFDNLAVKDIGEQDVTSQVLGLMEDAPNE